MSHVTWTDIHFIAELLEEAHPEEDIYNIRFTKLHELVMALDGFSDSPDRSNERILEAIQQAWLEEREANT